MADNFGLIFLLDICIARFLSLRALQHRLTRNTQIMHKKNAGGRGFTLVELMFSLLVIGVLTAIAIPTYTGYIDKTKIKTAISDIYFIQICIERIYTETFQYPPTIAVMASCLPNNGIDPWGNAYVYLNIIDGGPGIKGQVRKDKKLNPINTNYDLYSMGKDGVTKKQLDNKDSVDDIVLAGDGGFVGLSSDFWVSPTHGAETIVDRQ